LARYRLSFLFRLLSRLRPDGGIGLVRRSVIFFGSGWFGPRRPVAMCGDKWRHRGGRKPDGGVVVDECMEGGPGATGGDQGRGSGPGIGATRTYPSLAAAVLRCWTPFFRKALAGQNATTQTLQTAHFHAADAPSRGPSDGEKSRKIPAFQT